MHLTEQERVQDLNQKLQLPEGKSLGGGIQWHKAKWVPDHGDPKFCPLCGSGLTPSLNSVELSWGSPHTPNSTVWRVSLACKKVTCSAHGFSYGAYSEYALTKEALVPFFEEAQKEWSCYLKMSSASQP